jgi:hypothetical protein
VKVIKGSVLSNEMSLLQWSEDRRIEDPRYPNDACDAFLYAYREAQHWLSEKAKAKVEIGSREWYEKEEKAMIEEYEEEYNNPNDWWN